MIEQLKVLLEHIQPDAPGLRRLDDRRIRQGIGGVYERTGRR
jgi:hypothetical protein